MWELRPDAKSEVDLLGRKKNVFVERKDGGCLQVGVRIKPRAYTLHIRDHLGQNLDNEGTESSMQYMCDC